MPVFAIGGYQLSWEGFLACALIATSTAADLCRVPPAGHPAVAVAPSRGDRGCHLPSALRVPEGVRLSGRAVGAAVLLAPSRIAARSFWSRWPPRSRFSSVTTMASGSRSDRCGPRTQPLEGTAGRSRGRFSATESWPHYWSHRGWCGSRRLDTPTSIWDFLLERSDGLTDRARLPAQTFDLDRAAPLVKFAPIEFPIVGIRWAATASLEERRQREQQYSLDPIPSSEDRYRLTNLDSENVRALLLDPAVEDTAGIDRASLRVPEGGFAWIYLQLQRYVPLIRLRVLPGIIKSANAQQWLTDVTFVVPWIVLVIELIRFVVRRKAGIDGSATTLVVVAAALSIITYQTLVRASPDSRLGDIVAVTAILLGWLIGSMWSVTGWLRYALRPVAIVLIVLTVASAFSFGRVIHATRCGRRQWPDESGEANDGRRHPVWGQTAGFVCATWRSGLAGLARWLNECTAEGDRLSIIGFEPQVFFLAERGFAGGLAFYDLGWNSSERDQALTMERWSHQRVPVILAMEIEWGSFSRDYPSVRAWIDERYEVVEHSTFGGNKPLTVLTHRTFPSVRHHASTGLPCFR